MSPQPTPPVRSGPPRYELAVLTTLAVYPLVTALLWLVRPLSRGLPLPVTTLLLTLVLVSALTWVVMPLLQRVFRRWLAPTGRGAR